MLTEEYLKRLEHLRERALLYPKQFDPDSGKVQDAGEGIRIVDLALWFVELHAAAPELFSELRQLQQREKLGKDWRRTLNNICDLVGHPRIGLDEGFTASVAERVATLSRDHDTLNEIIEHHRTHPNEEWAASLEHHEEHHEREEELQKEIDNQKQRIFELQLVLTATVNHLKHHHKDPSCPVIQDAERVLAGGTLSVEPEDVS